MVVADKIVFDLQDPRPFLQPILVVIQFDGSQGLWMHSIDRNVHVPIIGPLSQSLHTAPARYPPVAYASAYGKTRRQMITPVRPGGLIQRLTSQDFLHRNPELISLAVRRMRPGHLLSGASLVEDVITQFPIDRIASPPRLPH